MPKSYYFAEAPDGSIHQRQTDRTYSHAVLVRRADGAWHAPNFCGRADLAETERRKKEKDYDEAIVVEVSTTDPAASRTEADVAADSSGTIPAFDDAETVETDKPKRTMKTVILDLAMDSTISLKELADMVKAEFPGSAPTHKSVASVICVHNRTAADAGKVPARQRKKMEG